MHNLFYEYKPDRKWNLSFMPRFGGWINVREFKAAPILGVGLANTYRLNDKWQLFADVNYTFVPSMTGIQSGTDHGGNSYAEERRFPCVVWKGFPAFPAHLRMRPVSRIPSLVELVTGTKQAAQFLGIQNDTVSLGGTIQGKFTVIRIDRKSVV